MAPKKRSGFLVETQTGKLGRIYSDEKLISGKIVVHIDNDERPSLSKPENLKIVGRFD
jgi:hypothetical protein